MRISRTILIAAISLGSALACAQAPAPAVAAAPPAPVAPSATLQPALDAVRHALLSTYPDRWKRGTIREEASGNINDILRDIETNVPPLMHTADADPDAVSKVLPLAHHVDALYDVLLRVVQASRVVASGDQVDRLQSALVTLGNARITLENQLEQAAVAQEKQIASLHHSSDEQKAQLAALRALPPPPPCNPPKPVKRTRRHATAHKAVKPKPPAASTQKH